MGLAREIVSRVIKPMFELKKVGEAMGKFMEPASAGSGEGAQARPKATQKTVSVEEGAKGGAGSGQGVADVVRAPASMKATTDFGIPQNSATTIQPRPEHETQPNSQPAADTFQMAQEIWKKPELMEEVVRSPEFEEVLNDPAKMQAVMQAAESNSNPQMQAMLNTPEVRDILSSPEKIRQLM